ncbi:MAG TPA: TRAP transporter small permease [Brevundimonas sp.]|jgi:TRAP-type C4-dicarboxylate transport system permease small subunit|uniref:TRAP transporter small permease n=1 Tax=Brevundimonas sp. TaxID=1871086 RepID=UPI002DF18733|nr:TRAP transporter small permease [Brevundimonas sp.]
MSDEPLPRRRALDGVAAVALGVACACLVGMAVVQAWQVFARYVLNDSPGWTEPVALLFMGLAVMLGTAVAVRRESHFAFNGLTETLPPRWGAATKTLSRLIALAAGLGLAWMGSALMIDDWSVAMAGAGLPSGLRFLGLAVGGALIALFAGERLLTGDAPALNEEG